MKNIVEEKRKDVRVEILVMVSQGNELMMKMRVEELEEIKIEAGIIVMMLKDRNLRRRERRKDVMVKEGVVSIIFNYFLFYILNIVYFLEDYDEDRERRERRRRERYYDEDYTPSTSGRRSQNTSDREFDRYSSRRSRGGAYEQPYQNYGYDPYSSYYQQQQYFEMLRRTNPQAYEWYKNYYSMMQQQQPQVPVANPMDDIGGSLRSGYSSGAEKDR